MARTVTLSHFLWLITTAWLAGCGRIDFDPLADAGLAPQIEVADSLALTTRCGAAPAAAALVVKNTGDAELTITRATATGGFSVVQAPTSIAPGETAEIAIRPPLAIIGTDRGGQQLKPETLTLETNAGTRTIQLAATVVGTNIDVILPNAGPSLAFASSNGCPAAQTVTVKNTGNIDISIGVALNMENGVAVAGFRGGPVTLGQVKSMLVRPVTTAACAASGGLHFQMYSGASGLCTPEFVDINVTLDITGASTCSCS